MKELEEAYPDLNFFVSGSIGSKGTSNRGTAVFGGDVVVSGSFRAKQLHYTTHKFNKANSSKEYVRFDSNGVDAAPGSNNKMIAPYSGVLLKVLCRGESTGANTDISFHRNTDGNAQLDATAVETQTTSIIANNTSTVSFTAAANFAGGDIIGLSIDPTNQTDQTIITAVWEYDTYDD